MAAGEGRRLRPLTERYAKAVLPIDGRPVILGLLEELRSAGVGRVTVVTGHLADQVERLLDGAPAELRVRPPDRAARLCRRRPPGRLRSSRRTSCSAPIRSSLPGPSAAFVERAPAYDNALAVRPRPGRAAARPRARRARGS